jgi:hypothetical protein
MFEEKEHSNSESRMEAISTSMLPEGHIQLPACMSPGGHKQGPAHRPVCDPLCDLTGHTNQTEPDRTKTLNVNGFENFSDSWAERGNGSAEDEFRVRSLALEILEVCRDKHSRGFYRLVAQKVPEELIRAALSETRYQDRMGRITKSRGAFFTDQLRRLARESEG